MELDKHRTFVSVSREKATVNECYKRHKVESFPQLFTPVGIGTVKSPGTKRHSGIIIGITCKADSSV